MPLKLLSHNVFSLLLLSLGSAFATPALAADGDMAWQFFEMNDPENKGAMTASLIYGVPETDNVQVMGVCDARPSTGAKFSSVTFGADIGDLANGADAELRFSGGGFEQTLKGNVARAAEEGVSGIHLDLENGDALWAAFTEKKALDYQVPGYRAAPLKLEAGRDKIKSFIEACRTYEKAVLGDQGADIAGASGGELREGCIQERERARHGRGLRGLSVELSVRLLCRSGARLCRQAQREKRTAEGRGPAACHAQARCRHQRGGTRSLLPEPLETAVEKLRHEDEAHDRQQLRHVSQRAVDRFQWPAEGLWRDE